MITVKANKTLWEDWGELTRQIDRLKVVVHSNVIIDEIEIKNWEQRAKNLKKDMDDLIKTTSGWLRVGGRQSGS